MRTTEGRREEAVETIWMTMRKGVVAAVAAALVTELLAGFLGWPSAIFLMPLQPLLGSATPAAGLLFRAVLFGALFVVVAPRLAGRSLVLKAMQVALAGWLLSLGLAALAGERAFTHALSAAPSRIFLVLLYAAVLGAACRLLTPEQWAEDDGRSRA